MPHHVASKAPGNQSAEVSWGGLLQSEFEANGLPVAPTVVCATGSPLIVKTIAKSDDDTENKMFVERVDVSYTEIKKHKHEGSSAANKVHLINKLSKGGSIAFEVGPLEDTLTMMVCLYVISIVVLAIVTAGIILPFPANDKQGRLLDGWTAKGPRHMRVVLKKDAIDPLSAWSLDLTTIDLVVESSLEYSPANANSDQNKESQNDADEIAEVTHLGHA